MDRVLRILLLPGRPHEDYRLSAWCFQRLLGLTFLISFVSLFVQLEGLLGPQGIVSLGELFEKVGPGVEERIGARRFTLIPTVFWWLDPASYRWVCGAGIAASSLLLMGVASGPMLLLALACSVSFTSPGVLVYFLGERGWFLGYQWDALLLETGFLALFLAPWIPGERNRPPARGALWLLWWLTFRLMFASGAVKLAPFDPAQEAGNVWRALTALDFHYWTQPLPTVPGWYAAQLPLWFHEVSVVGMFAVELGVPFLLFLPRWFRRGGALALVALQAGILVTGNYGFFNLLTLALCLLWLDDGVWKRCLPRVLQRHVGEAETAGASGSGEELSAAPSARSLTPWSVLRSSFLTLATAVLLYLGSVAFFQQLRALGPGGKSIARAAGATLAALSPGDAAGAAVETLARFQVLNPYGLFASMTVTRPEIVLEGSHDGETWLPYEFRYKPGDLERAPPWVQPHMPRLDWQMWFEALRWPYQPPSFWFQSFVRRLLEGSAPVLALLEHDPFPGAPPRFLRATAYLYTPAGLEEHRATGAWWKREFQGLYLRPVSLGDFR